MPQRNRIPEETLERIRTATDIVDLVSGHVKLTQKGRNFWGLCPFHTEKTASFSVNSELQIFRCFGCGAGGNVFKFVQEIDRVSFLEAVSFLGRRSGIEIQTADAVARGAGDADQVFRANEWAAKYFHFLLRQKEGEPALSYLHNRGLSDEIIDRFYLGYSPSGWSTLIELAGRRGHTPEILKNAGLALSNRSGKGFYDRFRNRVMFPIANLSRRSIGFGARALNPDDEPKYLNSPETIVYHKGSVLYGLNWTRSEISKRDRAIVVEGYMDLLGLAQAGIDYVVASSGTALTEHQCRTLGRYARSVVLVFDGDIAGSSAAMRGLEMLIGEGIDTQVVSLPGNDDPDTFVRREGGAAFENLVEDSESALDFYIGRLAAEIDITTMAGKSRAVERVMPLFAKCTESVIRDLMLRHVSQRLGVDEKALRADLGKVLTNTNNRRSRVNKQDDKNLKPELKSEPEPPRPERDFIGLLLQHPQLIEKTGSILEPGVFTDERVRELASLLFSPEHSTKAIDLPALLGKLENPKLTDLISSCAMIGFDEQHIEEQWTDYVRTFKRDWLTHKIAKSKQELETAVQSSKDQDISRINTRMMALIREKHELDNDSNP
tara:strand:- start:87 stop:1904 length:1818 start_codon:yes stop_codon:yes gene_type:complete